MSANLMKVFTSIDWERAGKKTADLLSLTFNQNKRTGAKIARAVFNDGTILFKKVTESGVLIQAAEVLPKITSVAQRNEVIKDLSRNKHTQQEIAAILNISQATVSNVLKKK